MTNYRNYLTYLLACDIINTANQVFDLAQKVKECDQESSSWLENMAIHLSMRGCDIMEMYSEDVDHE